MFLYSCNKDENITSFGEVKHIRGINITCANETVLYKSDIETWKSWKINTVRLNFNKDDLLDPYSNNPTENAWNPYLKNVVKLKQWLNWFKEANIQVIIALDMIWGDDHKTNNIWANNGDNPYLQHRIDMCNEMQTLAKDYKNVVYIEFWNEPYPYNDLYATFFLPKVVNEMETKNYPIKLICMAPYSWGGINGLENWDGLKSDKIIYSTHIYAPWLYTHQEINGNPTDTSGWPGWHKFYDVNEQPVYLDISSVREHMKKIELFKTRTGSNVIITEFGVIRWAIDNDKYISDLLTVFEENKIPWIFHSMSGWNGWNPTFSSTRPQTNANFGGDETDALKVLKTHWLRNE